jgi:MtN3 and saliva related transmembrane protein
MMNPVAFALPIRVVDVTPPARAPLQFEVSGMVTLLGVAAAVWGLVMAVAPVLQIRMMLTRRSSQDVSLGYFGVLLPGFGLWIGYGAVRGDWALVIPNVAAFAIGVITLTVALVLRRRPKPSPAARPSG